MPALPLRIRRALPILLGGLACAAAPAAPAEAGWSITRHFPVAGSITIRVQGRLASASCAPRLVLPGNRLEAAARVRGRSVMWRLRAGARSLGSASARPGRTFSLRLDAHAGTVSAQTDGRVVRRRVSLVPEDTARIVLRSRRQCSAAEVKVDVGHLPVALGHPPAPARPPATGPVNISVGYPSASTRPPAPPGQSSSSRPFSPDSVWNRALAPDAALDVRSAAYVDALNRQVRDTGAWINTTSWSTPVYTVAADQPTVEVKPDGWAQSSPLLTSAWQQVPIPAGAQPAAGTDQHMVVWQPATDTMWEFWRASRQVDGWHASWGGRMDRVSASPGYFTTPADWGATATSLPLLGGLIRPDELAAGHIDHALAIAIPQPRASWSSWPAQRTDGTVNDENAIPEGARFRLDPTLDLSAMPMTPLVRMLAQAAQRYGIVVRDRAGDVTFYAEDPVSLGGDPYTGPAGYFGSGPLAQQLAQQFPWQRLQALQTQLTQR